MITYILSIIFSIIIGSVTLRLTAEGKEFDFQTVSIVMVYYLCILTPLLVRAVKEHLGIFFSPWKNVLTHTMYLSLIGFSLLILIPFINNSILFVTSILVMVVTYFISVVKEDTEYGLALEDYPFPGFGSMTIASLFPLTLIIEAYFIKGNYVNALIPVGIMYGALIIIALIREYNKFNTDK